MEGGSGMGYLGSKELQSLFQTEGVFYELDVKGRNHFCRSAVKIRRSGVVVDEADALFVLTHPGKCAPVDDKRVFPINPENISGHPFIAARPHETEYQAMRLMERMKWDMIYMINLSDLCADSAKDFLYNLYYMDLHKSDQHSMFSSDRLGEIDEFLSPGTKIIVGWGVSGEIKQRATEALAVLKKKGTVTGHEHKIAPFYYHPYQYRRQKRMEWVDYLVEGLKVGML